MANTTKVTKKDRFATLKAIVEVLDREDKDELIAFIDHEVELLSRKRSTSDKPSKKQIENEGIKADILAYLGTVERAKVGEIVKALGDKVTSSQQVSALVTQLKNDGKVVRTTEKKDIYFSVA